MVYFALTSDSFFSIYSVMIRKDKHCLFVYVNIKCKRSVQQQSHTCSGSMPDILRIVVYNFCLFLFYLVSVQVLYNRSMCIIHSSKFRYTNSNTCIFTRFSFQLIFLEMGKPYKLHIYT